tara:strand:- start:72 stop:254 length:183 start_codon:yes stop_codon:yes gene_type:complete
MNPDIKLHMNELNVLKKNIDNMSTKELEIILGELLKLADALEPNYEEIILLLLENLSENS